MVMEMRRSANSKFQVYTLRKTVRFGRGKTFSAFFFCWFDGNWLRTYTIACSVSGALPSQARSSPMTVFSVWAAKLQRAVAGFPLHCLESIHGFVVFEVSLMAMKSLRLVKMGRSLWHRKVPWVPWQRSPELLQNSSLELRIVFPFP